MEVKEPNKSEFEPCYLGLSRTQFEERIEAGRNLLASCLLCSRRCGVNRLSGELGFCRTGDELKIASITVHNGEEPPLSGEWGSGTVFFSHCSMACVFCQNYPVSQIGTGREMAPEELGSEMMRLKKLGVHNINLVTPAHQVSAFLPALYRARSMGLDIPIVYNTSGYESMECLRLLDGLIDIYLPDMKYSSETNALKYSDAPDYPRQNRLAVKEMFRQVGNLITDEKGIALRGLVIRHLVLPLEIAGTEETLEFIARHISQEAAISLMAQYFPAHRAGEYPELERKITGNEYQQAMSLLEKYGLSNGWVQDVE